MLWEPSNEKEVLEYYAEHSEVRTAKKFNTTKGKLIKWLTSKNITLHTKEENRHFGAIVNKETCLERYGVINAGQLSDHAEKVKKTSLEKYGVEHVMHLDEIKNKLRTTMLENHGGVWNSQTAEWLNSVKSTNKSKYNCDWYAQTEECKKRVIDTKLNWSEEEQLSYSKALSESAKNFWDELKSTNPKGVEERINKVVESTKRNFEALSLEEQANKILLRSIEHKKIWDNTPEFQKQEISKKHAQAWAGKSEEEQNNIKLKHKTTIQNWSEQFKRDLIAKQINSKRNNKTFTTSKIEDKVFIKLSSIYPSTIRQYSEERYPFACDFYIPELDLFIELNIAWTHGKHKFDPENIEDERLLQTWVEKAKTSNYYKNAIYTWTDLDIRKINTAEKNKLKYKSLYNNLDIEKLLSELAEKKEVV